jgi:hypothetical protein
MLPVNGPPTSPGECALAFAIPTTAAEALGDLRRPAEADFAAHVLGRPVPTTEPERLARYNRSAFPEFVSALDRVVAAVTAHRVGVIWDVRLTDLPWLLSRYRVVTLVAHSPEPGDRVEFRDGLHPREDVVSMVPVHDEAILDLAICYSRALAEAVQSTRREWQVMGNEEETSLPFRLLFYKSKIELIARQPLSYLDADRLLRLELREPAWGGRK